MCSDAFPPPQSALPQWQQPPQAAQGQPTRMHAARWALGRQGCPHPPDALDRLAEARGPRLLRTPPYPPALHPLEACWAVVQHPCAATGDDTATGLRAPGAEGCNTGTPAPCQAAMAEVRTEEDRDWREEMEEDEG